MVESDSEEEFNRDEVRLSDSDYMDDDFEGNSPQQDRPNNIELLSLDDVRASLKSEDEDDDEEKPEKFEVEETEDLKPEFYENPEPEVTENLADTPEGLSPDIEEPIENELVEEVILIQEDIDDTELDEEVDSPDNFGDLSISATQKLKEKYLSRGSPQIIIERLQINNLSNLFTDTLVSDSEEKIEDFDDEVVDQNQGEKINDKLEEEKFVDLKIEDEKLGNKKHDEDKVSFESVGNVEEKGSDFDSEVEENELAEISDDSEHNSPDPSARKSARLSKSPVESVESGYIRRSGRERKSFPCAVKKCTAVEKQIDKILRHIKVNLPVQYATLITVKHSKVYKVCEHCAFIFMHKESFNSHIELNLCNENRRYWQKYRKEGKFEDLDMKILNENYEWKYSNSEIRRSKTKRQPTTPSKQQLSKSSPSRSSRPSTPSKSTPKSTRRTPQKGKLVTRSGRKVKVPQLDGINDDSDDGSDSTGELVVPIPQLDGSDRGQSQGQAYNQNQMQPGVQMYAVNQGNSGVIPIIMPPGTFGNHHIFWCHISSFPLSSGDHYY